MNFHKRVSKMELIGATTVKSGYNGDFERGALMYSYLDKKVYLVFSYGLKPERILGNLCASADSARMRYDPNFTDDINKLNYYFLNTELFDV